jgi:predicted MFS family arabinose efflux permease
VLAYVFFLRGQLAHAALSLIFLLCLASFFNAFSAPVWFSWLADIIPQKVHGGFMGRRDGWMALMALAFVLPCCFLLDRCGTELKPHMLTAIFLVGILLGMLDLFLHRSIPEPAGARDASGRFWEQVLAPFRDPEFRPWLLFTTFYNFAMMAAYGLCMVFFMNDLGLKNNFLAAAIVLIAVPLLGTLFTSKASGALIDRLGVRFMMIVSHLLWTIVPVFWLIPTRHNAFVWLFVSFLLRGAASSAALNATNKIITRVPSPERRTMYIAVTAGMNNLAAGVGPLAGGFFLGAFAGRHWTILGGEYAPFHVVFAASIALRLLAWLLLFRMRTPAFDRG